MRPDHVGQQAIVCFGIISRRGAAENQQNCQQLPGQRGTDAVPRACRLALVGAFRLSGNNQTTSGLRNDQAKIRTQPILLCSRGCARHSIGLEELHAVSSKRTQVAAGGYCRYFGGMNRLVFSHFSPPPFDSADTMRRALTSGTSPRAFANDSKIDTDASETSVSCVPLFKFAKHWLMLPTFWITFSHNPHYSNSSSIVIRRRWCGASVQR